MNVVNAAPRSHTIATPMAIVQPGASQEFVFASNCQFREQRTCVFLSGEPPWIPRWEIEVPVPETAYVEFRGEKRPLSACLYRPLYDGNYFDVRMVEGDRVSIRVVNGSDSIIAMIWWMAGIGILPVAAPLPRGEEPLIPTSAEGRLALFKALVEAEIPRNPFYASDEMIAIGAKHAVKTTWRYAWHEVPLEDEAALHHKRGVMGYWWRVRRVDGAWDVCRFDVEPVPVDATAYEWKRYSP